MNSKTPTCLLVIFSMWIGLFTPLITAQGPVNEIQSDARGLQFQLREAARENPVQQPPKPPVQVENLNEADANAILERLPPIQAETEDTVGFGIRPDTPAPPRTGKTIPIKFPADKTANAPTTTNSKTLSVLRFSPEGKAPLVTDLTVTFSQPMIAVGSQVEASEVVPVRLTPDVKGRWRWLGTQTLVFDAETRFPMATKFTATIPKGTKSAVGGKLPKDVSWAFTTPLPKIEKFAPDANNKTVDPRYALMAVKFNQEFNGETVLPFIKVLVAGTSLAVAILPDAAEQSYSVVQDLGELKPKHLLVFRTIEPLPLDSEITVVFEKGLPSAEGPGVSEAEQRFSFRTYAPLKFVRSFCAYGGDRPCEPSHDLKFEFNNSLAAIEPGQVEIEPPIADVKIVPQGNQIFIQGRKKPNTIYTVRVSGSTTDFYGQTLGEGLEAAFSVDVEYPQFFAPGRDLMTLDPESRAVFSVYSKNHPRLNVRLYSVAPEDYPNFIQLLENFRHNRNVAPTPDFGRLVLDETVEVKAEPDALTETRIDLKAAIPENFGHALLIAEPTEKPQQYYYRNLPVVLWLQATNIGIDSFIDYKKLIAFASDLKTGRPLPATDISFHSYKTKLFDTTTDDRGLVEFRKPEVDSLVHLIVKKGPDSAVFGYDVDWRKYRENASRRWFVFDDRKMYRPNEEVSIKGYLRQVTGGTETDIAPIGDDVKSVEYIWRDQRNNEIKRGTVELNAFGAFDFKINLPENVNLGYQRLQFWSNGISSYPEFEHTFRIEEFRRPEFEVRVESETPAPFFVGNTAVISAEAKYYSGGPLPNNEIDWAVYASGARYSPPNQESFNFGAFIPWWREYLQVLPGNYYGGFSPKLNGTTDENGKHRIEVDLISANPARPYSLRATAQTQDVNRQVIADTESFLVHPADLYVGLRTKRAFTKPGEPLRVETITTDIDGRPVGGAPVTIKAVLTDWERVGNSGRTITVDEQECRLKSTEKVAACEFSAKQGGTFTFTATVLDTKERPNSSELQVWVAGGKSAPNRQVELEKIDLIPGKKDYQPGETAEILVNAPFFPAEGVLTLERNGIIKAERFALNDSSTVLQIPVEERYLPNFHVKVDLVGNVPRTNDEGEIDADLPPRPAIAVGELNLNVSTASRRLHVAVEPSAKIAEPGERASINVAVRDASDNPVAGSEVALIAVDEGVLALTAYSIPNPLEAFYQQISANVAHFHSREQILLGNPEDKDDEARKQISSLPINARNIAGAVLGGFQIDGASGADVSFAELNATTSPADPSGQIGLRRNFNALAIFSPSVRTDENGMASVELKLPDNLTRYRITAVAVTDSKQFGLGESNITAKKILQVRPSAPRFMNYGDRFELPVVVQNQSDEPLSVDVAIRSKNAGLTNGNGRRVLVPANDRVEIRFPVAAEQAGTARFQIGAVSGNDLADAAEIELPVYTPSTNEAFATYGTTESDGPIVQTILAPKDVFPEFGGLEITTSSTQLQQLTDAFIYLHSYSFECSEQIASRAISVAALRDVLTAFNAEDMPRKADIEAKMKWDISRLQQLQHGDGGWSFWRSDDVSVPFVSVHVAHAVARVKEKGYAVPDEMIARSRNYLNNIESVYPETYSQKSRWAISAYALYVRNLLGDNDSAKAKKLINEASPDELSAESIGWLLSVLVDDKDSAADVETIKRHLLNRVSETAGNAHFVTDYKDGEYVLLSSERRADAIILEGLLKADPNSDLIPKIVRGLLAGKTKGRWQNTQENVFVLLALDKYFRVYEKTEPDFVARIWLGNAFAGEQNFTGRSTGSNSVSVPMDYLQAQGREPQKLILDKQGPGRLYYRIGMKYAPKNLNLAAADYGFVVGRTFEGLDDANDVAQAADGRWVIKAGARVRIRIKLVAPTRRYHVALVDNLPAGVEIINTDLATSGNFGIRGRTLFNLFTTEERSHIYPMEHQNLRDNRAEAFTTLLDAGVWEYAYLARATTPGDFVVPPARAEEMYAPETFGRSKTDFVRVE